MDEMDDVDDDVAIEMSPDGLSVLSCLTCGRAFGWADAPSRVCVCEDCARRSARSSARRGGSAVGGGIAGRNAEDEASPALRAKFPRQPSGPREPGSDAAGDPRHRMRSDGTLEREDDERGQRPGRKPGKTLPPPMQRRA